MEIHENRHLFLGLLWQRNASEGEATRKIVQSQPSAIVICTRSGDLLDITKEHRKFLSFSSYFFADFLRTQFLTDDP